MSQSDAFAALEAQLWKILEPYREHLEPNAIYGLPTLRWPGARAHDFFAGVRVAPRHVALHFLPVIDHPEVMDGASDALRGRLKGKATFNFRADDEPLVAELPAIVRRGFDAYREAHER